MNFRMNCAQVEAPISAAQSGSGSPSSRRVSAPCAEGPVDDHGNAALRRQRQEPVLRLAVDDVVGELHEVERLAAHDLLEEIVPPAFRRGDADIADLSGRLHLEQRLEMRLPGDQIVHLHEIEAGHTPERRDCSICAGPSAAEEVQTFSAENSASRPAEPFEAVADDRLRGAVHGRGIDHAPARLEEGGHHVGAFVAEHRIVADIEGDPGAETDDRDHLAG